MGLEKKERKLREYLASRNDRDVISIADLEIKEAKGRMLENEEEAAIRMFHKQRFKVLRNKQKQASEFNAAYHYFRHLYNLIDYRDLLSNNCSF
jgi:hypothetical protein